MIDIKFGCGLKYLEQDMNLFIRALPALADRMSEEAAHFLQSRARSYAPIKSKKVTTGMPSGFLKNSIRVHKLKDSSYRCYVSAYQQVRVTPLSTPGFPYGMAQEFGTKPKEGQHRVQRERIEKGLGYEPYMRFQHSKTGEWVTVRKARGSPRVNYMGRAVADTVREIGAISDQSIDDVWKAYHIRERAKYSALYK